MLREDVIRETSALSEHFGRDVIFYDGKEAWEDHGERGYIKGGKIYVNIANDTPTQTVIAHEMTHAMKGTKAFDVMLDEVKRYYKDSFEHQKDVLRGYGYSEAELDEEVLAHFAEQKLLTDAAWIHSFMTENGKAGERFANVIVRGINSVIQKGLGGKETRFLADVRTKWLKALEEERKGENEETAAREAVAYAKGGRWNPSGEERKQMAEEFSRNITDWNNEGRSNGELFILTYTGDILQGLGAVESDIYMRSNKINKIMRDHPEMSIEEIKMIPEILNDPVLILESKNSAKAIVNTRLVILGEAKYQAKNKKPVIVVFDIYPHEKNMYLQEYAYGKQKTVNAFGKENIKNLIKSSNVLYIDKNKKRTDSLFGSFGFQLPTRPNRIGSIGNITYDGDSVKISGEKFSGLFNSFQDVHYAKGRSRDAAYMAAVEEGDMETAQRLVDEAAKAAGYTVKVYHGTPQRMLSASKEIVSEEEYKSLERNYADKRFPFVIFRSRGLIHSGIYTSTDRGIADAFSFSFNGGTIFDLYAKTKKPLIIDAHENGWNNIPKSEAERVGLTENVLKQQPSYQKKRNHNAIYLDDLVDYAKQQGYDSVIVENVRELGLGDETSPVTTDVILFEPSDVKSADPVTYDDGRVIPLSERFDEEKEDIRWAKGRAEVDQRLYGEFQDWLRGKMPESGYFTILDETPAVMKKFGANNLPIIMEDKVLVKVTGGKHEISLEELAKLPALISEPTMMFKGSVPRSFVLITDMKNKNGIDAVIAIHIDKAHGRLRVNKIASVHPRTDGDDKLKNRIVSYVHYHINEGDLIYADSKKAPVWFTTRGLSLPKVVQTIIDANNSISENRENVNSSDEVKFAKGAPRRSREAAELAKYHEQKLKEVLYSRDRADGKELWDMLRAELNHSYRTGAYRQREVEKIVDFAYRTGYREEENRGEDFSLGGSIYIPGEFRGEMETLGGLAAVNRSLFGTGTSFTYQQNGNGIDETYEEARSLRPDLFPETDNPSEQVQNIVDALTRETGRMSLEDLDDEAGGAFADTETPYYNDIKDAVIDAMDEIAAVGRRDMRQQAKQEGRNVSAASQYRRGRESGMKQGERRGRREAETEQDRLDRATMREFDKLERQRAEDRRKEISRERRDDEATMRIFDDVVKQVRREERDLSREEKRELTRNFEQREREIKAEQNRRAALLTKNRGIRDEPVDTAVFVSLVLGTVLLFRFSFGAVFGAVGTAAAAAAGPVFPYGTDGEKEKQKNNY